LAAVTWVDAPLTSQALDMVASLAAPFAPVYRSTHAGLKQLFDRLQKHKKGSALVPV